VAGLDWPEALLVGAILAPTDPVFAAALVGNDKVPPRLRHLLNVESGVNDGLALPFVVLFWPSPPAPTTCTWVSSASSWPSVCRSGSAYPGWHCGWKTPDSSPPPPHTSHSTPSRSAYSSWR
jgi:hypothetical protein